MNQPAINYANGLARKWGIHGHCQFVDADVYGLMDSTCLSSYPPSHVLALVMVNFPTPFRYNGIVSGNRQLPSKEEFLVRRELLQSLYEVLDRHSDHPHPPPLLLIQTNAEDVAVEIDRVVKEISVCRKRKGSQSYVAVPIEELRVCYKQLFPHDSFGDLQYISKHTSESTQFVLSKRDVVYRASLTCQADANQYRAYGDGFLSSSPLPRGAMSETEAACILDGKTIYRLAYIYKQ